MGYNLLGEELEKRLSSPRFSLATIGSFEELLQYGCSQRATEEPVGVPILRMSNLNKEGWDFTDLKYVCITDEEVARWRLEPGDIVFNRTNSKELVGKCEVFDRKGVWVFASYLMRLRVDRNVADPEFVAAFLSTEVGRLQIDRESRQIIGMSNINAEEIRTLRIPLPKVSKQKELLGTLNAARSARREKRAEADTLLSSLDAFVLDTLGVSLPRLDARTVYGVRLRDARQRFDPDFNSPRFRALRKQITHGTNASDIIGNLFHPIVSGFAAGGDDQTDDATSGIPHIRPLNISSTAELHFEGTKRVPRSAVTAGDILKRGEILFNNTNSTAWVGKSVVFDSDRECACSNHITRLTLIEKDQSANYFAALFNALRGLGYFGLLATNFNNQAGINVETLKSIRVPVPDRSVQHTIAVEVARRRALARKLRQEADELWESAKRHFEDALLGPMATGGSTNGRGA